MPIRFEILVVHDELDLPPCAAKLEQGISSGAHLWCCSLHGTPAESRVLAYAAPKVAANP